MSGWRPEGWKNPWNPEPYDGIDEWLLPSGVILDGNTVRFLQVEYEKSADAVLKATRDLKPSVKIGNITCTKILMDGVVIKGPGTFVFIPDDSEVR
jgi:hypothetical protein